MDQAQGRDRRATIVLGILLIGVGVLFLVGRQLDINWFGVGWPVIVIGAGVGLFVLALAAGGSGGAGLAVPAGIVTMTGLVLAVQNATGLWETWAYAWAIVAPGGVGLGLLAYGLLIGDRDLVRGGGTAMLVGLGLFFGFGLFFEGIIGLSGFRVAGAETILSVGLIALGVVVIVIGVSGRFRART